MITINGTDFSGLKYAKEHKYIFESSGMEMIHAMNRIMNTFDETEECGITDMKIYKKERMRILIRNSKNNILFHRYIDWYNINKNTTEGEMVSKCISPSLYFVAERSILARELAQDKKNKIYKPSSISRTVRLYYEQQPIKKNGSVFTIFMNDGDIDTDFCDKYKNKISEVFTSPIAKPEINMTQQLSRQELILTLFKTNKSAFKFKEGFNPTDDDIVDKFYRITIGNPTDQTTQLCIHNNSFMDWVKLMTKTNYGVQLFEGAATQNAKIRSISSNNTYQGNICKLIKIIDKTSIKTQDPEWSDIKSKRITQEINNLVNLPFIDFMQIVKNTGADVFDNRLCQPIQRINCTPEKQLTYSNKGKTRCALQALINWCERNNLFNVPRPVVDES